MTPALALEALPLYICLSLLAHCTAVLLYRSLDVNSLYAAATQPLMTAIGRRRTALRAIPAAWHVSTTSSTSL